ncbi:hypothetical protein MUGA111182_20620 [Mucilaginibacter galii]|uniref:Tetratricopeptide repeat protein n=1 Tax=Mucilaginibacter galii TaxID=2005073 RepID=A0A917N359_9SPHI|nr:hypothetical protein [Mucilaginibacter galii]GGI52820.1 hypothetical protein GCM10011425_40320 [Mucilaginibacter galii]
MRVRFAGLLCMVFGFMLLSFAEANVPAPKIVRKQLLLALENRKLTDSLDKVFAVAPNKSPLNVCYFGVIQALKAKHAWNPYYKVKYLNDAEKILQTAVNHEPDNIEIRFMRFSIEHNVPGFLGYTKHLVADREEMLKQLERKYYATADQDVVITVIKFLLESKRCTPHENDFLHKQLAAIK